MAFHRNHLSAPETVFFEVTSACTYRCRHCFGSYGRETDASLSLDEQYRMVRQLQNMRVFRFIMGGGEPLLSETVDDLVAYAHDRFPFVSLSTNGHLADSRRVERLKNSGLKNVQVSLDGSSSTTHDAIRNFPGAFEKALSAIRRFVDSGFRVMTSTVITALNAEEIASVIELAESLGVAEAKFLPLGITGRGKVNEQLHPSLDVTRKAACELYSRLVDSAGKDEIRGLKISVNPRLWFKARPEPAQGAISRNWDCEAVRSTLGILQDGTVVPCVPLGKLGVTLGSLRQDAIEDLWLGEKAMALRSHVNMHHGACAGCELRYACRGGCKANVMARHGRFGAPFPDEDMAGICPQ